MGKGTILRIESGIELPSGLAAKLSDLFPDYTIKHFSRYRKLSDSYNDRADSLVKAFQFILKAYPPTQQLIMTTNTTLEDYVKQCRASCNFDSETLEILQTSLARFSAKLINTLMDCWTWTEGREQKEAAACLNEAEQYMLMKEGAKDIATVLPMTFGKSTHYVLQWDKRLPPYSDFWLAELKNIKVRHTTNTLEWLRNLKEAEQTYFSYLGETIPNTKALKASIFTFYQQWLDQTTNENCLNQDISKISKGEKPYPDWFLHLKIHEQEMLRHLIVANYSIKDISKAINDFYDNVSHYSISDLNQISSLPLWYLLLSETQQQFLTYVLRNTSSIEEVVSFLPSRLRTLPIPANFRSHQLMILRADGEVIESFGERLASSHIASRDVLKLPKAVQERHCKANLDAVLKLRKKDKPILIQTLISPSPLLGYIPRFFGDIPPDYELAQELNKAIASTFANQDIIHVNHPFNIAKRFHFTSANEAACLQLLKIARQAFKQNPAYMHLADKYEQLLNSGLGTATLMDWNGRELFLSSYEHLMIMKLEGLSYGSCVSGKDRKSIEFIHTDAMLLYRKKYDCWPDISETRESRQLFVEIVVDLYASYHAHQLAGQNAPGSDGIKTPANYWPDDISKAIKARLGLKTLEEDDRIATNNEVERICDNKQYSKFIKTGKSIVKLAIQTISEEKCQLFIDALALVINETERFTPERYLQLFAANADNLPSGISDIREIINHHQAALDKNDPENPSSAIMITAKICNRISRRPVEPGNRTATTLKVYELILTLKEKPEQIDNIIQELRQLKETSFRINSQGLFKVSEIRISEMQRSASDSSLSASATTLTNT